MIHSNNPETGFAARNSADPADSESGDHNSPAAFPLHLIPGTAGRMAACIAASSCSPNPALAGAAVLAAVSTAAGRGLCCEISASRTTYPNLYILVSATSGTGKTETLSKATEALRDAERNLVENYEYDTQPHARVQSRRLQKKYDELFERLCQGDEPSLDPEQTRELAELSKQIEELDLRAKNPPHIVVNDATQQGLVKLMRAQPGEALGLISAESRGHLDIMGGRYGGRAGEESFYCKAYSGEAHVSERVGRGTWRLDHPTLSLMLLSQPDKIRALFGSASSSDSGLVPRFLIFDADEEPMDLSRVRETIPPDVSGEWSELMLDVVGNTRSASGEPKKVEASPEALEILAEYERECLELQSAAPQHKKPFIARWAENATRLMLVLHVARHGAKAASAPVGAGDAVAAVEMMRWFAAHQTRMLSGLFSSQAYCLISSIGIVLPGDFSSSPWKRTRALSLIPLAKQLTTLVAGKRSIGASMSSFRPSRPLIRVDFPRLAWATTPTENRSFLACSVPDFKI